MKYCDIVGIHEYFQPFYDITNEQNNFWKQFIPNDKFYDILQTMLKIADGTENISLWLQGTYGTGKSHATAVIKHLLWDDIEQINDYIDSLNNTQIREKVRQVRKSFKAFPVSLKGASGIIDNNTFALVIQRAVKQALANYGIDITTRSDYEMMINHIENNPAHIDWDGIISDNIEIGMYVAGKEDLIAKLKSNDIKIMQTLNKLSSKIGVYFSITNICEWLDEVTDELINRGLASSLIIYWDEFTTVLELNNISIIINELQNIAELSANKNIHLFIVSHRKPQQSSLRQDDIDKVLDRFETKDYAMKSLTTYHIMAKAFHKKDEEKWLCIRNEKLEDNQQLVSLINEIVGHEGASAINSVKDLFPIHPYTAYLSTYFARIIGSTDRSIFSFLHDKNHGYLSFIEDNPNNQGSYFLTSDYLWDFFLEDIEKDAEKFQITPAIERYKLHSSELEELGKNYIAVFKGVLLLNILYRAIQVNERGSSLVLPSINNIIKMFLGTNWENEINIIMDYIDSKEYIQKTPDNLYLISSASLPFKEIENEKANQASLYEDLIKTLNNEQKKYLTSLLTGGVLREVEICFYHGAIKEHVLRQRFTKEFKKDYSLHIALFLLKNEEEKIHIQKVINNLVKDDDYRDIIFVIIEEPLSDENFNKFIDYLARASVALKHNFESDVAENKKYSLIIIQNWLNKIKNGFLEWYIRDEAGKALSSEFSNVINETISEKVFSFGFENLNELKSNQNLWNTKHATKCIEIFLFMDKRIEIEGETKNHPYKNLRAILKENNDEYIVNNNLDFKEGANKNHPLVRIAEEIKQVVESAQSKGVFNLGIDFAFLAKSPYGLYPNMVNMSALSFCMKRYVGKLYEAGTGKSIGKELMRDKISSMFRYWQSGLDENKLEVRLGTEEERELINIIVDLFGLKDVEGLNSCRWKLKEWVDNLELPLWLYKVKSGETLTNAVNELVWLIKSIDREISHTDITRILGLIKSNKIDIKLKISQTKIDELFLQWLNEIDNIEKIDDQKKDEILQYLKPNMPGEVSSWDEDKCREKVKDWQLEKFKINNPTDEEEKIGHPTGGGWSTPKDNDIETVKTKVRNFNGNLKDIIIKVIDRYPYISNYLVKSMEESGHE